MKIINVANIQTNQNPHGVDARKIFETEHVQLVLIPFPR